MFKRKYNITTESGKCKCTGELVLKNISSYCTCLL